MRVEFIQMVSQPNRAGGTKNDQRENRYCVESIKK